MKEDTEGHQRARRQTILELGDALVARVGHLARRAPRACWNIVLVLCATDSPSPSPVGLVEKKGAKMRGSTSPRTPAWRTKDPAGALRMQPEDARAQSLRWALTPPP
ncbi:MAG: hypothetical protein AMXMBFR34_36230 [Myxococcaceae bacterium]